jgi:GNAT superfamily N-acetyltransferase
VSGAAPIELSSFGRDDADAVCRLFGEVYARREPLTVGVGQSADEFAAWMRGACPKAVAEGLSVVARRAGGGEPLGALIAEDGAAPFAAATPAHAHDPIHALLSGLDAQYRAGRTVRPGEWLHLFLLVVADEAAGQGLASRMIEACLGHAARRGWRHAYTEATHPGSQRAFAQLGFETRLRRGYADWRFRGVTPFAGVARHGGVMLMDRELVVGPVRG